MSQEQVVVEHATVCRRCDGLMSSYIKTSNQSDVEKRAKEDPDNFFRLPPGGKAHYRSLKFDVHGYSCD